MPSAVCTSSSLPSFTHMNCAISHSFPRCALQEGCSSVAAMVVPGVVGQVVVAFHDMHAGARAFETVFFFFSARAFSVFVRASMKTAAVVC